MANDSMIIFGAPMLPDPDDLAALMAEAVAAGWLSNGGILAERLERALRIRFSSKDAMLVSSGTMALMMALRLGGIPQGAEVITTPLSFPATVQAIRWCGFTPVFADVEPDTLSLCPQSAAAAITPRTAAILPVHLLGVPCDTDAFAALAKAHALWLVYDAAQAFEITWHGQPLARFGDASALSLHATKLLNTGEGGVLVTKGASAAHDARQMRNFGLKAGQMRGPGINGKMSEAQAALGLALLPHLDQEISKRQALRAQYNDALSGIARPQPTRAGASDSLLAYTIRIAPERREAAREALARAHVLTGNNFPLLCGPHTDLPDHTIISAAGAPIAPKLADEVLRLPLHGRMTESNVDHIANVLRGVL